VRFMGTAIKMGKTGFLRGTNWKAERGMLWTLVVLAAVVVLIFTLVPSVEQGRTARLQRFLSVIPEAAAEAFNAADYQTASEEISTAYRRNLIFYEEFALLKDEELINHFTPSEVIGYFANSFPVESIQ